MALHHPDLVQTPRGVSRLRAGGSHSGLWRTWGGAWAGTHWGSEFPPPALGSALILADRQASPGSVSWLGLRSLFVFKLFYFRRSAVEMRDVAHVQGILCRVQGNNKQPRLGRKWKTQPRRLRRKAFSLGEGLSLCCRTLRAKLTPGMGKDGSKTPRPLGEDWRGVKPSGCKTIPAPRIPSAERVFKSCSANLWF